MPKQRRQPANPTHNAAEQHARSVLARASGNGQDYAEARTALAREQMARVRQIRMEAARELINSKEVRRILVDCASAFSARMRGLEKRFRAAYPGLPPAVYAWWKSELEKALALMATDVLDLKEDE